VGDISIGMVGAGYMGNEHSLAYLLATRRYARNPLTVTLRRIADVDGVLARKAALSYGWHNSTENWHDVTQAPDVDLVDIVTPNHLHAEIAIDALLHGKHVVCEKPLASDVRSATEMYDAARRANLVNRVGFVLRHWPVVKLAKRVIEDERFGEVLTFRATYLQDLGLDPNVPFGWRFDRVKSGAGSLADIGSHVVDLARYFVGDIRSVLARFRIVWRERPGDGGRRTVEVEDLADVLLEFREGATGVLSTSWVAAGHKTDLQVEVAGTRGSVSFAWERPNALNVWLPGGDWMSAGLRTLLVKSDDDGAEELIAAENVPLGLSDLYAAQARSLLTDVCRGAATPPTFLDGLCTAHVVEAAVRSDASGQWTTVESVPDS
jgi:predicted dehydrogenase